MKAREMDPATLRRYARSLDVRIRDADARVAAFERMACSESNVHTSMAPAHTAHVWRTEARALRRIRRDMRRAATRAERAGRE